MPSNIVPDGAADADNAVSAGHDAAVGVDAVEPVDCSDKGDLRAAKREPGEPGWDAAAGVDDVGAKVQEKGAQASDAHRSAEGVFPCDIEEMVVAAVLLDRLDETSSVADDVAFVTAQGKFAAQLDCAALDPSFVQFGKKLDYAHSRTSLSRSERSIFVLHAATSPS